MEKYSLNDCIKNLADIQKEVANGCKFVTYNYELAVLAVIAAFKRIGYRDLFSLFISLIHVMPSRLMAWCYVLKIRI